MDNQPNNPLHGVKLAEIVEHLVEKFGWEELGARININCFNSNPSVKSSLKFLRKTPWAREKVERLYLKSIGKRMPRKKRVVESKADPATEVKQNDVEKSDTNEDATLSPWDAAKRVRDSRE